MMGGQIDWTALDTLADLLGITDPESWIVQLTLIRDHMQAEE